MNKRIKIIERKYDRGERISDYVDNCMYKIRKKIFVQKKEIWIILIILLVTIMSGLLSLFFCLWTIPHALRFQFTRDLCCITWTATWKCYAEILTTGTLKTKQKRTINFLFFFNQHTSIRRAVRIFVRKWYNEHGTQQPKIAGSPKCDANLQPIQHEQTHEKQPNESKTYNRI